MRVKIYGAGSIGNHLSFASTYLGWQVDVYDIDDVALNRMKYEIYPKRYGAWNENIKLYNVNEAQDKYYDFVFIGTPPESHVDIILKELLNEPKAILVEKPVCCPFKNEIEKLKQNVNDKTRIFAGYNHVVSEGIVKISELISSEKIGEILTIDVEFRENWRGIFEAHPWLEGPKDSYLGFWEKGGGASGEHSHAINLWQYLARVSGFGKIVKIKSMLDFVKNTSLNYDQICSINFKTESSKIGRVIQDVITSPIKKQAVLIGSQGKIEWKCHYEGHNDMITIYNKDNCKITDIKIEKKRQFDFIKELEHIDNVVLKKIKSPLDICYGIETMEVLNEIHNQV